MIRRCSIVLCLLLTPAAFGLGQAASPTQDSHPDALALLQSFMRAVGGEVAVRSIQSMEVQGQIRLPGGRAPGSFHWVVADGGRAYFETAFPGLGRSAYGADGQVGWSKLELPGTNHIEAVSLEEIERRRQRANWFELAFTMPKRATKMHTIGPVEFNGIQAWEVALERADGRAERLFIDRKSKLLLGVTTAIDTAPESPLITVRFSDWRKVDDLRLFHRIVISGGRTRVRLDITKITLNTVNTALFAPPDAEVIDDDNG